eukprot:TRINITY_DN1272_c0_g1_i1.p1 TRINITY_DN1272_c0_g1~~TRINITY_DN1272_c0_g1_i1.p1  ORF type:complete len:547 (-),score=142.69 TRINITY_DN1272_c0_g1_i1:1020-2660(-)
MSSSALSADASSSEQVYFFFNLAAHAIACTAALFALKRLRHTEHIRSRNPLTTSFFICANFIAVTMSCLSRILRHPCRASIVHDFMYNSFVFVLCYTRGFVLYIKFQIAHETLEVLKYKRLMRRKQIIQDGDDAKEGGFHASIVEIPAKPTLDTSPDEESKLEVPTRNPNLINWKTSAEELRNSLNSTASSDKVPAYGRPKTVTRAKMGQHVENEADHHRSFKLEYVNLKFTLLKPWSKGKRVFGIAVFAFCVLMLPGVYFISVADDSCQNISAYRVLHYVYQVLILFGAASFAYLFSKERLDHFWLYNELKALVVVGVPIYTTSVIIYNVNGPFDETSLLVGQVLSNLFLLAAIAFDVLIPAVIALGKHEKTTADVHIKSLQDLLSTEDGEESFTKFLDKEFSLENWLFIKDCWQLKKICNEISESRQSILTNSQKLTEEAHNLAKRIFEDYVKPNATLWVNLSAPTFNELKNKFSTVDDMDVVALGSMYANAEEDVMNLLQKDSFLRYLKSEEFKQLKKAVKTKARESEALRAANLVNSSSKLM